MRNPSRLRYVQCELPDDVEQTLIDFEDNLEVNIQKFYDRLSDFIANDLPPVLPELDAQIALRNELLRDSPVQSLSSLSALDTSTGLTDPSRDDTDPETIRLDERKLGAAGICLINGRIFKMLSGDSITAIRHLWEMSQGSYDYFVRLGTAVTTSDNGTYTLFEKNPFTPDRLPYVNKGFTFIESIGLKNSQFRHRLVWSNTISSSYALKSKLADLDYDSTQINNVFSGSQPNYGYDFSGNLQAILTLVQTVTRIVFLPKTDPIRQPAWQNEANYIELAITRFLNYRMRKYTTSSVLNSDYWTAFLSELRPNDIKELCENRPEIKNIELPQDMTSITALVEKAVAIPAETTLINTYMNNLPISQARETSLTHSLYDLGLAIYRQLIGIGDSVRGHQLEMVLLELIGSDVLVDYFKSPIFVDPQDLSTIFPSASLPPIGELIASVQSVGDQDVVNAAVSANSETRRYEVEETTTNKNNDAQTPTGNAANNVPSGTVNGFPSVETPAMLLMRRVQWDANFTDCSGGSALGTAPSEQFPSQSMAPIASFDKESSVESNAEWSQHQDNMAYIQKQLTASNITLSGTGISDIRSGISAFISLNETSGTIAKSDIRLTELQSNMNTSSDIKTVASNAVEILKMTPKAPAVASTTTLASEIPHDDRGAEMYAAQNRNYITDQGGQTAPSPDANGVTSGLSTSDIQNGLKKATGSYNPWLGQSNKILLPFQANTSVNLQVCQSKALKGFDDYLKGLLTLPGWLVRIINMIKQQIMAMQDKIDAFIVMLQKTMDAILAKLERLLTIDLNFSGKIGFENSLFKCSWGIDLGLKIDLLGLLLMYLDRFLGVVLAPVLKFLQLLGDFINEIMCVPIRWIGAILNGAMFALANLLAKIGCTVKDFKLPLEIFDLLNLINGVFSLRSLVFKKGSADWLKMMGRISMGKNEFTGLSQFASMCVSDNLSASLSALSAQMKLMVSSIPVGAVKNSGPSLSSIS